MLDKVLADHARSSKVMSCAQKATVTVLKTRSSLQLLIKCGHVDTVNQPRWIFRRRALLHEMLAVTTVIGALGQE